MDISRRKFLAFMGRGAVALGVMPAWGPCTPNLKNSHSLPFTPLERSSLDELQFAEGFKSSILIRWNEVINRSGQKFGFNNDFLAAVPIQSGKLDDIILWVNHETPDPLFLTSGSHPGIPRTREQVIIEQQAVGGSLLRVKRNENTGVYDWVRNDPLNRRLDANSKIPLNWSEPIAGSKMATGTLANCAGGITPWGTFLTCEENYELFYGEAGIDDKGRRTIIPNSYGYGWEKFFNFPPEHYGWVVEVSPLTGLAKKQIALGRFSHECATVTVASTGQAVVYTGDDRVGGCLYKFISSHPKDLSQGILYAADLKLKRWIPLTLELTPALKTKFRSNTEILIHARQAAAFVGATPLDRPEDIEIDPLNKAVFVTQTNNKGTGNYFGSIMKIVERENNPLSLDFESSIFLAGGEGSGFACPDNMVFDPKGNLWITSDITGRDIGVKPYISFGNNSLFYVPMSGPDSGRVFRVASAPVGAEITGPVFSPDGKTLFISVQHPGETSVFPEKVTSHWPDGGTSMPCPAVMTVSGPSLEKLLS